jgi:hypothetical protein
MGVLGKAQAATENAYAVYGQARSSNNYAYGVHAYGSALNSYAYGVYALARATVTRAYGVRGEADCTGPTSTGETIGVFGTAESQNARGVYGYANGTRAAKSGNLAGVRGTTGSKQGYGVFSSGDFGGTGAKYFLQPHPTDASKTVQFICLEGNESGTYFRGKTSLANGRAEIPIPEEWRLVTEAEGVTVQVTPYRPGADLYVAEAGRERIVIKGARDCTFTYFVNGVRRGFAKYEPYLPNTAFRPDVKGVPFGTQYPDALRDILVKNGVLNSDYTPNEATAARLGWKLTAQDDIRIEDRWWLPPEERRRLSRATDVPGARHREFPSPGITEPERKP